MKLTTNDIIQIIGIIASLFTSLLAIIISIKTTIQNSKMIEENTRPYVTVYATSTNFSSPIVYLVMKNFGNSGATITKFECNAQLINFSYHSDMEPFHEICGYFLSPNQKLVYPIHLRDKNHVPIPNLEINISYKSGNKKYSEEVSIKFEPFLNEIHARVNNGNNQERAISYTLQDMVEKML